MVMLEEETNLGRAIAIVIIIIVLAGAGAGAWYLFTMLPGSADEPVTMVIDFTAWDKLAGSLDAATSAVAIYRMVDSNLVLQETVTMAAASTATGLTYTSGEVVYLKLYDASDTSICTQYMELTVPKADPAWIYDGAFQISLPFVDKGDTTKDILIQYHNNTAISASGTLDVTNESWTTNYAEIDLELRALDDDSGYVNTYNFLKGYANYHYIVMSASGTGWDSVNLIGASGWKVFEKASVRYFVYKLSDTDLTRDLQTGGEYDPDGTFTKSLVFDLTGFESGDSVTFTYQYRWYADADHFQEMSTWGVDTSATSESVTIQY